VIPEKFLITGLPRSRTAWISAYFQGLDGVSCFHEPETQVFSFDCLIEYIDDVFTEYTGVSSSGMAVWTAFEFITFSGCKSLIIDRSIEDVIQSLSNANIGIGNEENRKICDYVIELYDRMHFETDCMQITYEALDDSYWMEKIQNHLVPGVPFSYKYWESIMEMNIQVDMKKWYSRESRSWMPKTFGDEVQRRVTLLTELTGD